MRINIDEKVKSMKGSDIIMAMVNGLKNPACEINMKTFGLVKNGVCFGCAATNAIANIAGINKFIPNENYVDNEIDEDDHFLEDNDTPLIRAHFKNYPEVTKTVYSLEAAIDDLRHGSIDGYNGTSKIIGQNLPQIYTNRYFGQCLPSLDSNFDSDDLDVYIELAEYNKKKGN